MKKILSIIAVLAIFALPAAAQFNGTVINAGDACLYAPTLGIDAAGNLYGCGTGTGRTWISAANGTFSLTNKTFDTAGTGNTFKSNGVTFVAVTGDLGQYQGTTATAITDTNFNVLTGPAIPIPAAAANGANRTVRIKFAGVYTNAAASLLNVDIALCTVSGCATGTTLAPAGCVVTSTNQANNLTNGQFSGECNLTVATAGATGTVMAKATTRFNLGSATTVASSTFEDTATAVSAAVDLTVAEFIHPRFKFSSSNAGNSATLQYMTAELLTK